MAEKTKTITDIEKADAFYDAVMKYKEKIEKTETGLKSIEASGKYKLYDESEAMAMEALKDLGDKNLSDAQKEMIANSKDIMVEHDARERLLFQKEEYLRNVEALESQIKVAVAKYIVESEKEQKKLEANKEKYAAFVEGEKAKYETLKSEIESMERDSSEENKDILESKKEQLGALEVQLDGFNKRLMSFDERIAGMKEKLQETKEKYKDYIELSKEDIEVPEVEENSKEDKKSEEQIAKKEEKTEKAKKEEKSEENHVEVQTETPPKAEKSKGTVYVEPQSNKVEEQIETGSEKEKETDKQAYNRISKALLKKDGRISTEDTDRLLDILSNKDNFDSLNIRTRGFLFFKSKGEKIYSKLGIELDKKLRRSIKNKNLLEKLDTDDLRHLGTILELGNGNPDNNIVETIESAMEGADAKNIQELQDIKNKFEKFSCAAKALVEVKTQRDEMQLLQALPESKPIEVEEQSQEVNKNGIDGLNDLVKNEEEIAVEEANKKPKSIDKSISEQSDTHEVI